jgi:F420H(2)-dependent quinone reductase
MGSTLKRLGTGLHTAIFRASGGRIASSISKTPVLLLTTTGRKTGKPRTVPLLYLADGGAYAVIASNGGAPLDPAWCLNLRDEPAGTVQIGAEHVAVRAEFVEGDERERLWKALASTYRGYDGYTERTSRRIPVLVLRPVSP